MSTFLRETGPWNKYRERFPAMLEVDFHRGRRAPGVDYEEVMADVENETLEMLKKAQSEGVERVMFVHGASTSGPFRRSSRSVIRGFMRSSEATPYIVRRECIQHPTVFIAKIKL